MRTRSFIRRAVGVPLVALLVVAAPVAAQTPAPIGAGEYAARRDALAAAIDSGVVVAFGARQPTRHTTHFTQLPSFEYLTGFDEPDAAFVMVKRGGRATSTLFVTPVDPISAIFNGRRATAAEVRAQTGLAARPFTELRPMLDSLADALPVLTVSDVASPDFAASDTLTYGRGFVAALQRAHPAMTVRSADREVLRLRARKSAAELALIRKAAEISAAGHRAGLCALKPGGNEYQAQAMFEYVFREQGGDGPAYASIVGSGPNGTTLHYNRDDRVLNAGELVVMDVAAGYRGYAADVTRTAPVTGTFTPEQRALYQVVRDAQAAAERQVRAGAPGRLMSDSAFATMAQGLARLGLIEAADATFDPPWAQRCTRVPSMCSQRYLYMPHGLGHGIGLDVHDPTQYQVNPDGLIQPGDAFTIEPGVYVRPDLLDGLPDTPKNRAMIAKIRPVVERYKNTGVRIEDDFIVTERGMERISLAPREVSEIESVMSGCKTGPRLVP